MNDSINQLPTEKQLDYIADIEEYLGATFYGKTKAEATEWLKKFVPIYRRELDVDAMIAEAELEMIDARRDW